ncbi:MAG TPA: hypothetical protein VHC97_26310 [Thermoanaerobaculia bacterium]|nr:hypothetical protein [Thermoanaerobaculia bacterium]
MRRPAILPILLLALLAACAGRETEPRTGPEGDLRPILDALKHKDPATDWNGKSLLHADLDLDGGEDYALSGIRQDRFVVGIVHGPLAANRADSQVWTLDFPWDGGEDALCSKAAKISLEPLEANPGPKPSHPEKGMGINLSDNQCDAFHIYWNPQERAFEYWRL